RLFHSTEASYRAGVGGGSFGTVTNLFLQDFLDPVVANAAGVPATSSIGSQSCIGDGAPKSGYNFELTFSAPTSAALSQFSATGYAAGSTGIARTGDRNFFIDESGVIRASTTATITPDADSTPLNN